MCSNRILLRAIGVIALSASGLAFGGESNPLCIKTGADSSVEGYLAFVLDEYGSFTSGSWGGGNGECGFGDNFRPTGQPLSEAVFSNGFVLYRAGAGQRELLSSNANWMLTLSDASMDSMISNANIGMDTNTDGVDDRISSLFAVTAPGVDLTFELVQQVEEVPGEFAAARLTQTYTITNNAGDPVEFVLLRQCDFDLLWGAADYADDSVGTNTNAAPGCDRFVFQRDPDLPETTITITSPQGDVYYGSKNSTDPDCGGDGVPYGNGTDFDQWNEFGVPFGWSNSIAGVGCDTDGESGPASPGCGPGCDGAIGLRIPVSLDGRGQTTISITHLYGSEPVQDCEGPQCGDCPTDVDGNGSTDAFDLANLLGAWGPCSPGDPCECLDADTDGTIDAFDLATLLGSWGPCQ